MECSCSCRRCLKEEICRQNKKINSLHRDVCELKKKVNTLCDIIHVSPSGDVTIGSEEKPIDTLYVDYIGSVTQPIITIHTVDGIAKNFDLRGICLDDNTALLTPSFTTFPQQWLKSDSLTQCVRTYHYAGNDRTWIQWLIQKKICVMVGITLSPPHVYQLEIDAFVADYADPILKPLFDTYVIAIGVGNEQNASQLGLMKTRIANTKQLIQEGKLPATKVTTVLVDNNDWLLNTFPPNAAVFTQNFNDLYQSLDIICFNMYDAYGSPAVVPTKTKLSWASDGQSNLSVTLNGFGAVRNAMIKNEYTKPFWCTEVGWQAPAQSGNNPGNNISFLKEFYTNFLGFNMASMFVPQGQSTAVDAPDRIFYFTIRDVPSMGSGETFGLYESSTVTDSGLKPKF